jgi:hypothetical protein
MKKYFLTHGWERLNVGTPKFFWGSEDDLIIENGVRVSDRYVGVFGCICVDAGTPLSAMDGVLVAVKDEIDCMPYQTTGKQNRQ